MQKWKDAQRFAPFADAVLGAWDYIDDLEALYKRAQAEREKTE
jgi:hypothetical protein